MLSTNNLHSKEFIAIESIERRQVFYIKLISRLIEFRVNLASFLHGIKPLRDSMKNLESISE